MKIATEQLKSLLNLVIRNMIFKSPINTIKHTKMQDKRANTEDETWKYILWKVRITGKDENMGK